MSEHQSHDTGYKYLFSHAELVQELIEGFAPAELLPLLDFNSLTPVQGSYITPSMKSKEEDAVWRINMGDKPLYLYLLLEFQSSVDATMPVRMLQYVGALYESLISRS
jgi:predicted transposase/invertase (TIGR01784 family)